MSFVSRSYDEIVRDLLTTLTRGTVRESVTVREENGAIVSEKLRNRPVRRITSVEETTTDEHGVVRRRQYTPVEFELVATQPDEGPDTIRFRSLRTAPLPGAAVMVNYYPLQTDRAPLTDLSVGSVTRTLIETFARELALTERTLQLIYESAFLESATGPSLDKVVALTGVTRLKAGFPTVRLTFRRAPGSTGRVSVPVNTAVVDATGNRYLTMETLVLEPYESSREVIAAGETSGVEAVEQQALNRLETLIAGIGEVTNLTPSGRATTAETDDELRRRAGGALQGALRGTQEALRYGLLSIPGVSNVNVIEFPDGLAGEVRVEVAYSDESPAVRQQVARRILELKPAGIRVIQSEAQRRPVTVTVDLTLAGSGVDAATQQAIKENVSTALEAYLSGIAPGGSARQARMAALVLADSNIADAQIRLTSRGETLASITLEDNEVFDLELPMVFGSVSTEAQAPDTALQSTAEFYLPLHLAAGVAEAQARPAIESALTAWLQARSSADPLSIDGMAAAIRDDSRYVLVRDEASMTIEKEGTFAQLTDGAPAYVPAAQETVSVRTINIDVREGGV